MDNNENGGFRNGEVFPADGQEKIGGKNSFGRIVKVFEKVFPDVKKWSAFLSIILVSVLSMFCFVKMGSYTYSGGIYDGGIRLVSYSYVNIFSIITQYIALITQGVSATLGDTLIIMIAVCLVSAIISVFCIIAGVAALTKKNGKNFICRIAFIDMFINLFIYLLFSGSAEVIGSGTSVQILPNTGMRAGLIAAAVIMAILTILECVVKYYGGREKPDKKKVGAVLFGILFFTVMLFLLRGSNIFIFTVLAGAANGNDDAAFAICTVLYVLIIIYTIYLLCLCVGYGKRLVCADFAKKTKLSVSTLINFIFQIVLLILGIVLSVMTDVNFMMPLFLGNFIIMSSVSLAGLIAGQGLKSKK